jgi:ParG
MTDDSKLYDEDGVLRFVSAPAPVKEPERLSINMTPDLHYRFKVACTSAKLSMVDEVLAFIERRTAELEARK